MTRTLVRGPLPALLVLGLGLGSAVVGCSGGDSGAPPTKKATSSENPSPGESPTANTLSPPDLPEPPDVAEAAGAVADITPDDCVVEKGKQSVTGKVTNPTKRVASYLIVFNWTNDTSDVLGRGFTVVRDLGAGKTADWELTAKVSEGATQCVPNVKRGKIKKG